MLLHFHFNPRHPYGWRPFGTFSFITCSIFQSTPPIRVATGGVAYKFVSPGFQSTPPIRVATCVNPTANPSAQFQSTPPIRVATANQPHQRNPNAISIHATHTGGDLYDDDRKILDLSFQSTPPIRVATLFPVRCAPSFVISIHATHTGGDCTATQSQTRISYFNPRHPYGWRRRRGTDGRRPADFNPRHPYGWRHAPV